MSRMSEFLGLIESLSIASPAPEIPALLLLEGAIQDQWKLPPVLPHCLSIEENDTVQQRPYIKYLLIE